VQLIEDPEPTADLIRDRYDRLLERLRAAAVAASREPADVRVVAVTKGFGIAVARAAAEAGLRVLGENRVQEAEPKVAALPDLEWHLVGHLQSNKARRALALFGTIHSVDSVELLVRLERIAHDDGRQPRLLLQVNITGEERKAGFAPLALRDPSPDLVETIGAMHAARIVGLMAIGAFGASEAEARATFARVRALRDVVQHRFGMALPELSMGMSGDAEAAVAEGATMVRVGTALFGPRPH